MFNRGTIRKSLIALFLIIAVGAMTSSCMKEEKETKPSMDEIQEKEGLPVTVQTLNNTTFVEKMSFYSTLSGIRESNQGTNFAEKVVKINARVGDFVKAGQVIMELPEDIPSLQYDAAKLQYANAEKTYKRMKALLEAGETSQMNFDQAKMGYDVAKKGVESLEKLFNIETPFSGTIVSLSVDEGEIPPAMNPGMPRPLFTVAKLDVMKADINANIEEVNNLRLGMPATLAYNNEKFKGRVTEIAPAVDARTQAFKVEIQFPNANRKLKSGATSEIFINTYVNDSALTVPRNLVVREENKTYVYIAKNGIAQKAEVKLGKSNGVDFEILGGLEPGNKLINCCKTQLEDGKKVKIIK